MVAKKRILATLKSLDGLYRDATSGLHVLFYSKLAVLELCGWIEESMDDIALGWARRKLKLSANIEHVDRKIVKAVHGFDYTSNFRRMLIQLIGIVGVEAMEQRMRAGGLPKMRSALARLKAERDKHAHTHIRDVTAHIDAPSMTLANFYAVYEGLKECEAQLRRTIS